MTTSLAADIARINDLVEQALAKYGEESQDRRFADHTSLMLELLDEWITRAREINELRTRNGRRSQQQPRDHTEPVQAFEQRLTDLRSLLVQ
jgi:hypothetical protein